MNEYDTKMVEALKLRLIDITTDEFTDYDFLRWLQGHDYKIEVIVPLLRHHFRLLRCYDFANYAPKNEVMDEYWPYGLMETTGKGHYFPYIETQGGWDGEGVLKCVSKMDILLHRLNTAEYILTHMRKHENETGHQSGMIFIVDAEGVQMSPKKFTLITGPFKDLMEIIIKHYAELMKFFIVINAPTVLWALYSIIKPIMPEKTRKKFVVLGSNWKTEILQYCDPDSLPVHWGGTVVDENGDPQCRTSVVVTTKVPERFYWTPAENDPKIEDLTLLTVGAGKTSFITVEVTKVNSLLEWFYVTDKDWGFGVFFTDDEKEICLDKMEMMFPQIDFINGSVMNVVPEIDKVKCKKIGFYKIWFNNYFSWFTQLNVRYKITVS